MNYPLETIPLLLEFSLFTDPLFSLFKVRRARVIKYKPQGIYRTLAQRFARGYCRKKKIKKNKNKTTSVYRLFRVQQQSNKMPKRTMKERVFKTEWGKSHLCLMRRRDLIIVV